MTEQQDLDIELDAILGELAMPIVITSPEDTEKFITEFEEKGYSLICFSNAGTPPGMIRLTFLKKEAL